MDSSQLGFRKRAKLEGSRVHPPPPEERLLTTQPLSNISMIMAYTRTTVRKGQAIGHKLIRGLHSQGRLFPLPNSPRPYLKPSSKPMKTHWPKIKWWARCFPSLPAQPIFLRKRTSDLQTLKTWPMALSPRPSQTSTTGPVQKSWTNKSEKT